MDIDILHPLEIHRNSNLIKRIKRYFNSFTYKCSRYKQQRCDCYFGTFSFSKQPPVECLRQGTKRAECPQTNDSECNVLQGGLLRFLHLQQLKFFQSACTRINQIRLKRWHIRWFFLWKEVACRIVCHIIIVISDDFESFVSHGVEVPFPARGRLPIHYFYGTILFYY